MDAAGGTTRNAKCRTLVPVIETAPPQDKNLNEWDPLCLTATRLMAGGHETGEATGGGNEVYPPSGRWDELRQKRRRSRRYVANHAGRRDLVVAVCWEKYVDEVLTNLSLHSHYHHSSSQSLEPT